jgi:hypothetical protein
MGVTTSSGMSNIRPSAITTWTPIASVTSNGTNSQSTKTRRQLTAVTTVSTARAPVAAGHTGLRRTLIA